MACLTRENCQEILQKYSHNKLCDTQFSYCLKPSERHNILKMKFNPEISNSRPQFFVKTLDCTSSSVATNYSSNKEVSFYQYMDRICKKHDNVIPHIYFANEKNNTLVLEDLSKVGYKKCDGTQFDEDHIYVVLACMAKFHSLSIIHDRKFNGLIDSELKKVTEESCFNNITDEKLRVLTENLEGQEENDQAKLFREYKIMLEDFIGGTLETNVCCHGDLYSDNILFRYDVNGVPINCKFIDFAVARYKPPAHDLTMFLYTSVSSKLRQAKYNIFLTYYYTKLETILMENELKIEEILPMHEYELSCKKYMRYARMIVALYNSCQETKGRYKNDKFDLSMAIDNTILSIEDIHTIVQLKINTTNYDLKEYNLIPVAVKAGFLGEHMNLTVIVQRSSGINQTLKYFVKALPILETQRKFAIETGGIFKETSWFRKFIPDCLENGIDTVKDYTPCCYLARDNDVFVFEDLKEAGYEMISSRIRLDLDGIKNAIVSLAMFHAVPLILEELKSKKMGRQYRLTEDYAREFEETFYSNNNQSKDLINAIRVSTPIYVDLLPIPNNSKITREDVINMERRLVGEFYDDVQPSSQFRNSICHGDLWSGNIMFRKENGVVNKSILIDFQSYRYSPPAQDLMAMIYLTTDRRMRKGFMSYLTDYYYEQLTKNIEAYNLNIEEIISKEEFRRSVVYYEKFGIAQATTHLQVVPMSDEAMKHFFDDKEWARNFLFVDRTENLSKCCAEDSVYRNIQEETLKDLWGLCEKLKLTD